MPFCLCYAPRSRTYSQRGQAALLLLVLIVVGIVSLVYYMVDPNTRDLRQKRETAETLSRAKDALIGRAAVSSTRPGQLPCPDTNNDGDAEAADSTGCPSGNIGRLPWKTLGLNDPRDGAGERLWYAVSVVFTRNSTACCFDTDTRGTLTVSQDNAANVITNEAVAVIFAPGPVLQGQTRDAANQNNPVNYLDTIALVNNAVAAGPYISAEASPTFNDKLLVIRTTHLWPVVETRVAREMLAQLKKYKDNSGCGCYPWAANNFDDDSVDDRTQGMVPIEVALPEAWGSGTIPGAISWMIGNNEWGKKFYYAIAPSASEDHTAGTINVDGVSKELVLITTGPWGTGPTGTSRPSTNLADYVDDGENRDGGINYITPAPTEYARDRIYFCPGTPGIC
jgi:hypothetical protein